MKNFIKILFLLFLTLQVSYVYSQVGDNNNPNGVSHVSNMHKYLTSQLGT